MLIQDKAEYFKDTIRPQSYEFRKKKNRRPADQIDKEYLKLATALTFPKLEIMRDYGLGAFGYGDIKNKEIIIKNSESNIL